MSTDNWLYHTTNIIDIVQKTMYNTEAAWYKEAMQMMSPSVALHEFKTLNFSVTRRAGASTAALMLFDFYPGSVIFYPSYSERDYHTRAKYGKDPTNMIVMPDRLGMIDEERLLTPVRGKPNTPLVILDGTRRMRDIVYNNVIDLYNPFTKLFVLLG